MQYFEKFVKFAGRWGAKPSTASLLRLGTADPSGVARGIGGVRALKRKSLRRISPHFQPFKCVFFWKKL